MPGAPKRASLPDPTRTRTTPARIGWLDVGAGVSGDMLLGAFADVGVPVTRMQSAVDAVIPGAVELTSVSTSRAGMRATAVQVHPLERDPGHRRWSEIDARIATAALDPAIRHLARTALRRLGDVEAGIHGARLADVHFHEVGAWDSIADIVGVCAASVELGLTELHCGPVELGSGEVIGAHGTIPIPAPATLALAVGWEVTARLPDECATPTGMSLLRTLVTHQGGMPPMSVAAVGVGAGGRDPQARANVVRLVVGSKAGTPAMESMRLLEANVDDLDPRVWPEVLAALLAAGAADAWVTPILMKKGRPAHTLTVLAHHQQADDLRTLVIEQTSTLGVRMTTVERYAVPRSWVDVEVAGQRIAVKLGHRDGRIGNVAVEFDSATAAAHALDRPVADVLRAAESACGTAGFTVGSALPSARRDGPVRGAH